MNRFRKTIGRAVLAVDSFLENFAILSLLAMIVIVTVQVTTRKLFNYVFFWSEEITLLLLIWFSFMGIAVGFREKLHLAIDSFSRLLPDRVNRALDKIIDLATIAFGLYLVVYGAKFTALMNASTLPATNLPNSFQYAVMPLAGAMICVYALLSLIGVDTRRHKGIEGGH